MTNKIKELLSKDYVIVCDTNVYLRLYDYSPEFASFAIECLDQVKDFIQITYMTFLEYNKHYHEKYSNAKQKIEKYNVKLKTILEEYMTNLDKEFKRIEQYNFPDMTDLHDAVMDKLSEIKYDIEQYCENHELLIAVNNEYLKRDPVKTFWDLLSEKILPPYDFKTIYQICEEGEKRYKTKTPPGFKDKDKNGLRQFGDLILWKEIIDFSKRSKKNILFITDDVKEDWWDSKTNDEGLIIKTFHSRLTTEFNKKTGLAIDALTSSEFFIKISSEFNIEKKDTIEMALAQTSDSYIESIEDEVFCDIQNELIYSEDEYIVGNNNIGSEGISDFNVDQYELVDYEIISQDDKHFLYLLNYSVVLSATSCEYWSRDDDTKEVINSPNNHHVFEGNLKVIVTRTLEEFIDLMYEKKYESAEIESCELEETDFIPYYESSDFSDDDYYNFCPRCGRRMTIDDDAGNGFCFRCTQEDDNI